MYDVFTDRHKPVKDMVAIDLQPDEVLAVTNFDNFAVAVGSVLAQRQRLGGA